ncbi:MAG: 5'/3'-nucleotidase SurE [Burkholderiales bacterium]|nr:5'/3'-nucleotidase SurE [Phycisphaerae bacterium]
MLILLTNDDGITAPGLLAVYHELTRLGEVCVVAPETVQSAAGHGITISKPLLTSRVTIDQGVVGTAVDGRPADCVKLAISQIMPRQPDLVVSGINSGANVGINVLYSGTVAAAVEAAFLGLPSVALSLLLKNDITTDYARAARDSVTVIQDLLKRGLKGGDVVSVNLPALRAEEQPKGIKYCRQCTRPWVDTYDRRVDPRGRAYYWNSSIFALGETESDTDVAFLRGGFITVTPLQFDLTRHDQLKRWQS